MKAFPKKKKKRRIFFLKEKKKNLLGLSIFPNLLPINYVIFTIIVTMVGRDFVGKFC